MSVVDERNIDPVEEMARIAHDFLDLSVWQLKETYRSSKLGKLIYDSETCRVSLVWGGWDPLGGNNMIIQYGRLHAPNEKTTLVWIGEECHCWHRFEHALHFLDGRTPEYTSKRMYTHDLIEQYKQSTLGQKLAGKRRQPEWLAQMHVMLWRHYGKRLFDLFDLRRQDLWEQYRQFIKDVYDIKGRSPNIKPSLDKIC